MPIEPLTDEERARLPPEPKPVCCDVQHSPPRHVVIHETCAWVCPSCGQRTVLRPTQTVWVSGVPMVMHKSS